MAGLYTFVGALVTQDASESCDGHVTSRRKGGWVTMEAMGEGGTSGGAARQR